MKQQKIKRKKINLMQNKKKTKTKNNYLDQRIDFFSISKCIYPNRLGTLPRKLLLLFLLSFMRRILQFIQCPQSESKLQV